MLYGYDRILVNPAFQMGETMGKHGHIGKNTFLNPRQDGVATALICALLGFKCRIYMGATDTERQKPNVFRMRLMGAEVIPVKVGAATLKEACNEALRDYAANFETTHYMIGTAAGAHHIPFLLSLSDSFPLLLFSAI